MNDIYEPLKKKYNLPKIEDLNHYFDVLDIEDEHNILRQFRKKFTDKLESMKNILDDILHPDNNFSSIYESGNFSDEDREAIVKLYKDIMFFIRTSLELSIEDSDELNAKFINDVWSAWPNTKTTFLMFVKKLKEAWNGKLSTKEVVGYLG